MNLLKVLTIVLFTAMLSACGSHGFEGTYKIDTSKKGGMGSLMGAFGAGDTTFVIGSDYMEAEGQRTEYDDIFVRESGGKRYLVMKTEAGEEIFQIFDDNTIGQGNAMMMIKFKRVKS